MTVEESVRQRLLQLTDLTALVSTRIYLDKLPQSPTYPCVRVTLISDPREQHLRGPNSVRTARIQVDSYASESSGVDPYARVIAVADAVEGDGLGDGASGLSGWIGAIGSPALSILDADPGDRRRSYDPQELRLLTMSQDYMISYKQAAA